MTVLKVTAEFQDLPVGITRWCAIGERDLADIKTIQANGMVAARAVTARVKGWSKATQYHAARRMVSRLKTVDASTLPSSKLVDAGDVPNEPNMKYRCLAALRLNYDAGIEYMPLHFFKVKK